MCHPVQLPFMVFDDNDTVAKTKILLFKNFGVMVRDNPGMS
jgi:hypothetical protein